MERRLVAGGVLEPLMAGARAEIESESEEPGAWRYGAVVRWADGVETRHELRLAWVDHEYWSHGVEAPSAVAVRVLELACTGLGRGRVPARFDAATVRRWLPGSDERLIAGGGA